MNHFLDQYVEEPKKLGGQRGGMKCNRQIKENPMAFSKYIKIKSVTGKEWGAIAAKGTIANFEQEEVTLFICIH